MKDYIIEGRGENGDWKLLCNVTGNYQRRVVHRLPCSAGPSPAPPLPPPPPPTAPGAISATLCSAAPEQMWSMSPSGVISTGAGSGKHCLGFDTQTLAFGGDGKAVVARPCGDHPSAWTLQPASTHNSTHAAGSAKLIKLQRPAECGGATGGTTCNAKHPLRSIVLGILPLISNSLSRTKLLHRSRYARSFRIQGAGEVSVNGVYLRSNQTMDGYPVFQLDATHQLCSLY